MNKPKFKPVITRVKLNPEQAVLTCTCYNSTYVQGRLTDLTYNNLCGLSDKLFYAKCSRSLDSASS